MSAEPVQIQTTRLQITIFSGLVVGLILAAVAGYWKTAGLVRQNSASISLVQVTATQALDNASRKMNTNLVDEKIARQKDRIDSLRATVVSLGNRLNNWSPPPHDPRRNKAMLRRGWCFAEPEPPLRAVMAVPGNPTDAAWCVG